MYKAAIAFVVTCFGALTSEAPSSATLQGYVRDSSAAVIPGATTDVCDAASGFERRAIKEHDGACHLAALPPGTYRIEARAKDFRVAAIADFVLDVARTTVRDFTLEAGDVAGTAVVTRLQLAAKFCL